jgi:hypothetical protein
MLFPIILAKAWLSHLIARPVVSAVTAILGLESTVGILIRPQPRTLPGNGHVEGTQFATLQ